MKKRNILSYSILLIVILSSSFACDNSDNYSLGDFRISIATVIPESKTSYSLLLDNGDKLWPAASDVMYSPKEGQRVFVNYTLLPHSQQDYDHFIKINDIWNILTKPVISLTEQNADSIGNDPVRINDLWIGNHYLNIGFSFNYNGVRPHAINLVQNETATNKDEDVLELEFRHNSYNSTNSSLYDGFACFDLKPFQMEDKEATPIKVIVRDWNGEKEYELLYIYKEQTKAKIETRIPKITSNEIK